MRFLSLTILMVLSLPAAAQQRFSCGGAAVAIEARERPGRGWEERIEAVLTVDEGPARTILRYRHVDFIGGACGKGGDGAPLILFQAHCGGSACRDLDNWGAIDPRTQRVLLVPADGNRPQAAELAGGALPSLDKLSMEREAVRLGLLKP